MMINKFIIFAVSVKIDRFKIGRFNIKESERVSQRKFKKGE